MVEVIGIGNYGYLNSYAPQRKKTYNGIEDFKPGLRFPEIEEKTQNRKSSIVGLLGTALLATGGYLFLKKTSAGQKLMNKAIEFAKPYVEKGLTKGKEVFKKATEFAKPYVEKGLTKGKEVFKKATEFAKPYVEKAINFVKKYIPKKV